MLIVDERAVRPESPADILARNQFTRPLQEQKQHLKRLTVEFDPHSLAPQLARHRIGLKDAEAITAH